MRNKVLAVVPARYASTRFPGKIIAPVAGKPLVLYAYEQACKASLVSEALIATDAQEVVDALKPFNVPVMMTNPNHPSGTDRIAEVARNYDADIVVNVQGDEPLIDPQMIDDAIQPLIDDPALPMSTAKRLISDLSRVMNPNVVKVVCDVRGRALYFSRCTIPYQRDIPDQNVVSGNHYEHVGMYVYRKDFLLSYAEMPQTPLEKLEKLEQLRVLENGYAIAVVITEYDSIGVDVPEDLEKVRHLIENH